MDEYAQTLDEGTFLAVNISSYNLQYTKTWVNKGLAASRGAGPGRNLAKAYLEAPNWVGRLAGP